MNRYFNLLTGQHKSIARLLFGIIAIILGILWLLFQKQGNGIHWQDWLYSGVFAMKGIHYLLSGLGLSYFILFGKAYVEFDDEIIAIKETVFQNKRQAKWKDISSIKITPLSIEIHRQQKTKITIHLSRIGFEKNIQLTNHIRKIAKEKRINIYS